MFQGAHREKRAALIPPGGVKKHLQQGLLSAERDGPPSHSFWAGGQLALPAFLKRPAISPLSGLQTAPPKLSDQGYAGDLPHSLNLSFSIFHVKSKGSWGERREEATQTSPHLWSKPQPGRKSHQMPPPPFGQGSAISPWRASPCVFGVGVEEKGGQSEGKRDGAILIGSAHRLTDTQGAQHPGLNSRFSQKSGRLSWLLRRRRQ